MWSGGVDRSCGELSERAFAIGVRETDMPILAAAVVFVTLE